MKGKDTHFTSSENLHINYSNRLWEDLHIDKSQFNIVNYLFIWQSGRFGFNLPINVSLCVPSAYLVCEWVRRTKDGGRGNEVGGWRYHTRKGFQFVLPPCL